MKKLSLIVALSLSGVWAVAALADNRSAGVDTDRDGVPDSEDWCLGTPAEERTGADGCGAAEIGDWSGARACAPDGGSHPAGADGDQDGVPDSEDRCPHSAAGGRVGADGCAAGEIASACIRATAVKDGDRDGDGVPDSRDRCPDSTRGAKVDSSGCVRATVADSDGDGVGDGDDRCPGTARGIAVDRGGCALIEKVVLKGVNFDTGSATLKSAAYDTLRSVSAAMKINKKLKVEVGGYTDSVGVDNRNLALSERRANAVKSFLVKEGVAADRLVAKGYGEASPVDSNDTAEGRANNRRVGFKVTDD